MFNNYCLMFKLPLGKKNKKAVVLKKEEVILEKTVKETKGQKGKRFFRLLLKFIFPLLILLVLSAAVFVLYRLSKEDLFGWRLNFNLAQVKTQEYNSFAPTIAFKYPDIFELDLDSENKFGTDYLVGMKLKTDDRTGCDLRIGGPELDFSRPIAELEKQVVDPIRERATGLEVLEKNKTKIGGEDAFLVSFSFLDPIGARIRLDQLFTKGKDGRRYMIICGAGEYQFDFFKKDFAIFYRSINFEGKLFQEEKNWREFFAWIRGK